PWKLALIVLLPLALIALAVFRMLYIEPWLAGQKEQGVEQVLNDQVAAWNRGELEAFMDGYWHSPELTFYSGNDIKHVCDETLDRYRQRYQSEGKEMGKLSFSELRIEMAGPDTAIVRGRWHLELSQETRGGLFTLIVKRRPEGWRIVHDHTS